MGIKEFFDKMIIWIFIIILLIGLVFSFVSYRRNVNNRIEIIKNSLKAVSYNLKDIIIEKESIMENLMNRIDSENIEKMLKYVYLFSSDDLKYVYFANDNGDIIVYPEIDIHQNFIPQEKSWYMRAVNNPERAIITHSYADPERTEMVITLSKAIFKENKLFGVIGFDIDNEKILKILESVGINDLSAFSIIKKDEEILFNGNIDRTKIFRLKFDKDFEIIQSKDNIIFYQKIIDDIYTIYIYDKHILKTVLFKRIILYIIIVMIMMAIFKYNYSMFLTENIINPISEISSSMNNFNMDLKDKKIPYISTTYKIKEIKEIKESYEKLIGTSIASLLNFNLLTEEIKKVYNNLKAINEMFFEIINIITMLDNESLSIEEYFKSILKPLIKHVKEAKYGSISIIKNRKWEYIATIGHNLELLKSLDIFVNIDYDELKEKVNILSYDEMINYDENIMDEKDLEKLKAATMNFKYAMTYISELEGCSLIISVETPGEKGFSKESFEIFKAYVSLAKIFLYKKFEMTKIENIYFKFAEKLASVAEGHDDITGKHIYRVGEISAFLAEKMGYDEKFVEKIRKFAPLHDIGKIYVPYEILNKEGKLTEEEFNEIKKHTNYSLKLLSDDKYFETALNIALYHHENCDGSGYPYGLKCDEIPVEAAIVKIADIYDALRAKRSYKKAFSHETSIKIILEGDDRTKPEYFHKKVLEVFGRYHNEINEIWNEINKSGGESDDYEI